MGRSLSAVSRICGYLITKSLYFRSCTLCATNTYSKLPIDLHVNRRSFHDGYSNRVNPDVAAGAIHNVQSIRSKWAEHFKHMNIPEPEASAELIVAHILGCKTLHGIASWQIVPKSKTDAINELCKLRLKRMPVQYIIEEWDFRDMVLKMKPPVLIPRPETEELVTFVKEYQTKQELPPHNKILEIGCGTGAIILSLAKEYPLSQCVGIDKSSDACQLTRENADYHSLQIRVENTEFSELAVKEERVFKEAYDLIVSNPPYLRSADLENLAPEILHYEDVPGALDGGTNGLDVIESILQNVQHILSSNGLLWLEVDPDHPGFIETLTDENADWNLKYIKSYKDFLGKWRFCLLSRR